MSTLDRAAPAASSFWQTHLDGALPLLAFPTDLPRPARIGTAEGQVEVPLDPAVLAGLGGKAALLALYQVFLYRYSGQDDCVVGVAAGSSVTPLRQQLAATLPLAELVAANTALLAATAEHAAEWTAPPAEDSHAPVFQHRFTWLEDATPAPLDTLDTALTVLGGGTELVLQFNTRLHTEDSAARWARNLATLCAAAAAAPDAPIGELDLLHPDERAFIARQLDQCGLPFRPRWAGVHQGFEEQAARAPDALAVRCGTATLSYAELDAQASAIARHLHAQGVRSGDLVGLCSARTPAMIAAVIGILKTGAAYVPLDQKYPLLRLQDTVAEARLRFLLCDAGGAALAAPGLQLVRLEDIDPSAPPFPAPLLDEHSLSHVIFTSGSTGKPKGVMARHRNTLAFLDWVHTEYSVAELQRVMCCSSLCFDLTVFEIWGPLLVGGALVLVENPAALVQRAEPDLTLINTVPTALRLMLDEGALPPGVRTVNVCGEPLDAELVNDLFRHDPTLVFYNTYGPTEDTAYSTCFRMTGPRAEDPPIGLPLPHEFGRVVDAHGVQVPVGAVGELLIGGAGVARGYLHQPELTAERFLTVPDYAGRPAPAYRTGDFVRLRADGQLHFVGRRDDQVKLRGFRIDLGDVVAALGTIAGVTDVRVLVRRHADQAMLVAYLSHAEMPPGAHRDPRLTPYVEQEAARRLPAHMVPASFVLFDRLPLNANGKVDRQALAEMAVEPPPSAAPAVWDDPTERTLAALWQEILGVPAVGRADDFFQLGGNSLLAVRLSARLNRACGVQLPSQTVFEDRTVPALAARVRGAVAEAAPPLEPVDLADGVSPTYPQLALLMDAGKISFNLCSALQLDGELDAAALRRALRALVQRHDALRARFVMDGPQVRMVFVPEAPDVLEVADLADGSEAAVRAALDEEWARPFDLHQAGPVRALLLRLTPARHVLMLSVHHAVTDEWSTNILKHDLARLYAAELGQGAAPAPLALRYGDYAAWQARLHGTPAYARQLGYWAGQFAALRGAGPFPPSALAAPDPARAMAWRDLTPPPALAADLATLATRDGYTGFEVLLAALQVGLAAWSGLDRQLVWAPVARRTEPELEECVGMFTNLLAIAGELDRTGPARAFLAATARQVAQARAHSDVSALTALMQDPSLMPALPMIGLNWIDLPNEGDWALGPATVRALPLRLEREADLCVFELTVRTRSQGTELTVAYNPAVLHADDVQAIVGQLWRAVDAFAHRPELPLAALVTAPALAA